MNETAGARLARLLALVPWLRRNDGVTIGEAAAHFNVSQDQLTTDLWQLIVCGIPGYGPDQLVDIQFWDDDRIHVLDPIGLDRPLRLTGEEAAALVVALRVLAQVPGDHDRAALISAAAKVEAATGATTGVDVQVDADPGVAAALSAAIASGSGVLIEYASADADSITRRTISPYGTYTVDGRVYVEAWCDLAQDRRTFRLDRILSTAPSDREGAGAGADVEGAADDRTLVGGEMGKLPAEAARTARIAAAPGADWVWDSDPVSPDGREWNEGPTPGWRTGSVQYATEGWLIRYILGRGGQVVLVDPPELRLRLAREAAARGARLRAAVSPSG